MDSTSAARTLTHLPRLFNHSPCKPGFAGAVASSITCPIEVVKTQLQSSRIGGGSNPFKVAREILAADGE